MKANINNIITTTSGSLILHAWHINKLVSFEISDVGGWIEDDTIDTLLNFINDTSMTYVDMECIVKDSYGKHIHGGDMFCSKNKDGTMTIQYHGKHSAYGTAVVSRLGIYHMTLELQKAISNNKIDLM
jgi:hypothetical protein